MYRHVNFAVTCGSTDMSVVQVCCGECNSPVHTQHALENRDFKFIFEKLFLVRCCLVQVSTRQTLSLESR